MPLIVVPPSATEFAMAGKRTAEFASVKDVPATILAYAGVTAPGDTYKGRDITPASGVSLRGYLSGKAERPHGDGDYYAFELFGNAYVVQGDYKAMIIREGMWGDGEWHLYDILNDPGETTTLDKRYPEKLATMKAYYAEYARRTGLVPVANNWSPWFGFVELENLASSKSCSVR